MKIRNLNIDHSKLYLFLLEEGSEKSIILGSYIGINNYGNQSISEWFVYGIWQYSEEKEKIEINIIRPYVKALDHGRITAIFESDNLLKRLLPTNLRLNEKGDVSIIHSTCQCVGCKS